MEKVSLAEIAGGALQEKFDKAFENVIENLQNPNTPYKDARKITITLSFTQNEQRNDVTCDVSVAEKLAPQAKTKTIFAVGKDLKTGALYAEEYGKNQISMNFDIDTETGEIIEDQGSKIIDMRKANCN